MNHAMLDLETMGVTNSPALLQISAVQYDPFTGKMGAEFRQNICLESSVAAGLGVSASTIQFWMSPELQTARKWVLEKPKPLNEVLLAFTEWMKNNNIQFVHGNGSASDCVWLRSAYKAACIQAPFTFRQDMCMRTIRNLARDLGFIDTMIPFDGIPHDGLDDAKYQVKVEHQAIQFLLKYKVSEFVESFIKSVKETPISREEYSETRKSMSTLISDLRAFSDNF